MNEIFSTKNGAKCQLVAVALDPPVRRVLCGRLKGGVR